MTSRKDCKMDNKWQCGAFNAGLTIHPDGKASPCCQIDFKYLKNIDDLDWTDPWQELRDGRGCQSCKISSEAYKSAFDDYLNDSNFTVKFLDVRNNNLCNMECVICNPYYSSKWAERVGQQKFISTDFDIDLSAVDKIYFAGGEPFLNKKHWEILDNISNPEKVTLIYSSNLTYLGDVESRWAKFKLVQVNASLDGIGKFGEQVRPGLDWNRWQKNMIDVKHMDNVSVEIAATISLINIWYVNDMEDYAKEHGIKIKFYCLNNPTYFCLSTLPDKLKKQIKHVPTSDLEELLSMDTSHLFNQAIANILLGDRLRKTNLWDYLPFEKYAMENLLT